MDVRKLFVAGLVFVGLCVIFHAYYVSKCMEGASENSRFVKFSEDENGKFGMMRILDSKEGKVYQYFLNNEGAGMFKCIDLVNGEAFCPPVKR